MPLQANDPTYEPFKPMSELATQTQSQKLPSAQSRFAGIVMKDLNPDVKRAAEALWNAYEALDLEVVTTLEDAEGDLMAAMPVIDGYENEIGELVKELVADLRANFHGDSDMPLQVRFSHKAREDSLEPLLPRATGRLVMVPIAQDVSLHTTVQGDKE